MSHSVQLKAGPLTKALSPHPSEVQASMRLGEVPRLTLSYVVQGNAIPTAKELLNKDFELEFKDDAAAITSHFVGQVYSVSSRWEAMSTYRIDLECLTIAASVGGQYEEAATWRVFKEETALNEVLTGLLEDAGFPGMSLTGLTEKIPSQLLGLGQPAWALCLEVAALHGYAMSVNPIEPVDSKTKFSFVALPEDIKPGAQPVKAYVDTQGHLNHIFDLEVKERVGGTAVRGSWMSAHDKSAWAEGAEGQTIVGVGSLDPSQPVAELRSSGRQRALEATEIEIQACINGPFVQLGDAIETQGTKDSAGDVAGVFGEKLVVVGMDWSLNNDDFEGEVMHGTVELLPQGKQLPLPRERAEWGLQTVTGKVEQSCKVQGQMKVKLDVPNKANGGADPIALVEWTSPWFSGASGGFHFPPLVNDHVALLVDPKPFGRVVYLGAHPSQAQMVAVRKAFEEDTLSLAEHRTAETGPSVSMVGDHLARAIVVGDSNVMAWTAPKSGASSEEDVDTRFWHRVKASNGAATLVGVGPGTYGVQAIGPDAVLSLRSDYDIGLSCPNHLTAKAAKLVELTSEEVVDIHSTKSTSIVSKEPMVLLCEKSMSLEAKENMSFVATADTTMECKNLTQKCGANATIEASKALSLAGKTEAKVAAMKVDVAGETEVCVSGKQLGMKGEALCALEGGMLTLNA